MADAVQPKVVHFDVSDFEDEWNTSDYNYSDYFEQDFATTCQQHYSMSPVIYTTVLILLICLTLLSTWFILYVYWLSKVVKTAIDVCLQCICVNNLLLCPALCVLIMETYFSESLTSWLCKGMLFISDFYVYWGAFLATMISVERFINFRVKGFHNSKQIRRCQALCLLGACFSFCLGVPQLVFGIVLKETTANKLICYHNIGLQTGKNKVVLKTLCEVFGFLIPLAIMCVFYGLVIRRLCHASFRKRFQAMRAMLALVGVFMGMWAPYYCVNFTDSLMRLGWIQETCDLRNALDELSTPFRLLGFAQGAVGCILCVLLGSKFRANAGKVLSQARRSFSVGSGSITSCVNTNVL